MDILLLVPSTPASSTTAPSHSAITGKQLSTSSTAKNSSEKQLHAKTAVDLEASDLWVLIAIVVIGGVLGGLYNYRRTVPSSQLVSPTSSGIDWSYLTTCVLGGIIAGALIPLFLQTIQSQLLNQPTLGDFTVFAGLCLIAAISSNAFIDTLTKRVLDQINVKADAALQTAKAANTNAANANDKATDAHQTSKTASDKADNALLTAQTNSEIIKPIANSLADVSFLSAQAELKANSVTGSKVDLQSLILNPASKFRSVEHVAKESGQSEDIVQSTFNQLENENKVKLVDGDSKVYVIK